MSLGERGARPQPVPRGPRPGPTHPGGMRPPRRLGPVGRGAGGGGAGAGRPGPPLGALGALPEGRQLPHRRHLRPGPPHGAPASLRSEPQARAQRSDWRVRGGGGTRRHGAGREAAAAGADAPCYPSIVIIMIIEMIEYIVDARSRTGSETGGRAPGGQGEKQQQVQMPRLLSGGGSVRCAGVLFTQHCAVPPPPRPAPWRSPPFEASLRSEPQARAQRSHWRVTRRGGGGTRRPGAGNKMGTCSCVWG